MLDYMVLYQSNTGNTNPQSSSNRNVITKDWRRPWKKAFLVVVSFIIRDLLRRPLL